MADMNFGVNLLPASDKSNSIGSSSKKWDDIYADKINGQSLDGTSAYGEVGPVPIVAIPDALPSDAVKLVVDIEPVQDLHGYDHPWPGGGNLNLLDFSKIAVSGTHYGMSFSKGTAEGTIVISGTLSVSSGAVAPIQYADNSLSGKGYVFLTEHISGDSVIKLNRTYGFRTENEKTIAVFLSGNVGQSYTETIRISVYATTQTTWTPYSNICPITGWTGATVTVNEDVLDITFPSEAGTIYGGTLDVVNGVLTVDMYGIVIDDINHQFVSHGGYWRIYPYDYPVIKTVIGGTAPVSIYSDITKITNNWGTAQNGTVLFTRASNWVGVFNSVDELNALGITVVYKLATPITYQLTPQQIVMLQGENNIWADCGDTTVGYWRDDSLFINKAISERMPDITPLQSGLAATQSSIAIIVSGDRASMAVPVGGYAYIKNNTHGLAEGMYKNTSSSAFPVSGGTADGTVFTGASGGGLNALNASLGKCDVLLSGIQSTGNKTLNHSISQYKYVILGYAYSDAVRTNSIFPVDFIKSLQTMIPGISKFAIDFDSDNYRSYCFFEYVNDTTVNVPLEAHEGSLGSFYLLGLKG